MKATVLCALSLMLFLAGCNPVESKITKICENNILERLKAPSGYKRISVETKKVKISKEEYVSYAKNNHLDLDDVGMKLIELFEQEGKLYALSASLEYDAPNGYGALIRNVAHCEVIPYSNNPKYITEENVYTDGQTKLDYTINQMSAIAGKPMKIRKPFSSWN